MIEIEAVGALLDVAEHLEVPGFRHGGLERHPVGLQKRMEAHHAEPDGALPHGRIFGPLHAARRIVDEILQDVVEEAHDVFDEKRMPFRLSELSLRKHDMGRPRSASPLESTGVAAMNQCLLI